MKQKDNLGIVPQITAAEKKMYEDTEVTADDIKAWQKELDLKGRGKREWDNALINASKIYENS